MFFTAKFRYPDFPDTRLAGECCVAPTRSGAGLINHSKLWPFLSHLDKYQLYMEDNTLIEDDNKLTIAKYGISENVRIM